MTRKHFKRIAAMVEEMRKYDSIKFTPAQLDVISERLASVCAELDTSQGFNRARFLRACGVED